MVILIDPPVWPAHGTVWSHLVSDTSYAELHAFAQQLGLPRRSFDLDHYDVPASRYDDAQRLGALPVGGRELVRRLESAGLRVRRAERRRVTADRRREFLSESWRMLGESPSLSTASSQDWQALGENLILRWNEPHRRYHDERHLEDVLLALDLFAARREDVSPASLLAAWFHDAVYEGGPDDEAQSAQLAVDSLSSLGLAAEVIKDVNALVLASRPGGPDAAPASPTAAQFLDADLSILASNAQRYDEYRRAVRGEYAHVSDHDFARGRAHILQGYLDRPRIYLTDTAHAMWEQRARANLAAEIAELRAC